MGCTLYRARNKGMQILLSNSQAERGRNVKQEQEEISRNHVQSFIPGSVFEKTIIMQYLKVQHLIKLGKKAPILWSHCVNIWAFH